ncbi:hypothetical protein K449DRAFT_431054 [Hypoxylon sp. EC38]|nr:hypothetical protein K449DRAFT_431054 [Hypoxylon sp. EC38]
MLESLKLIPLLLSLDQVQTQILTLILTPDPKILNNLTTENNSGQNEFVPGKFEDVTELFVALRVEHDRLSKTCFKLSVKRRGFENLSEGFKIRSTKHRIQTINEILAFRLLLSTRP